MYKVTKLVFSHFLTLRQFFKRAKLLANHKGHFRLLFKRAKLLVTHKGHVRIAKRALSTSTFSLSMVPYGGCIELLLFMSTCAFCRKNSKVSSFYGTVKMVTTPLLYATCSFKRNKQFCLREGCFCRDPGRFRQEPLLRLPPSHT